MDSLAASRGIDFSRVFALGNAFKRGALHFEPQVAGLDFHEILLAVSAPMSALELRRESGRHAQDFMATTFGEIVVVSEHVVQTLRDIRATGWSTYPVTLRVSKLDTLPGYRGLSVTGHAGPIDRDASKLVSRPPAVAQGKVTYAEIGLFFDEKSWDGSDVFIPQGTTIICVVDRVRQAFEERNLTNVLFQPLSTYQLGVFLNAPLDRMSS